MTIRHATEADGLGRRINATDWDAAHTLTGTPNRLLGFDENGDECEYPIPESVIGAPLDPLVIVIAGQSNASGSNTGGPVQTNDNIFTWDGATSQFVVGGNTSAIPWTRSTPHGNSGNNNIAVACAHRLQELTGRSVYIVYDAVGGTSIDEWVASGTSSTRYAALKTKIQAALVAAGRTEIDLMIWSQGEEDYVDSYATHKANFTLLDDQIRAETFATDTTPIFVTGPSDLHDRYAPEQALIDYCSRVNPRCIYVSSNGLKTEFGETGSGDPTHFYGESLWEMGYYRIAEMFLQGWRSTETPSALAYKRGSGQADAGDAAIVWSFSSACDKASSDAYKTSIGSTAPGLTGPGNQSAYSLMGGIADGNYTMALGSGCVTNNLANYTHLTGRDNVAGSGADYCNATGYQQSLASTYQFAAGRGHTLTASGQAALGLFSKYTDGTRLFQYGIGSSSAARKNALGIASAGNLEVYAPIGGGDPGANEEITFCLTSTTNLRIKAKCSDGTVRVANITLA